MTYADRSFSRKFYFHFYALCNQMVDVSENLVDLKLI